MRGSFSASPPPAQVKSLQKPSQALPPPATQPAPPLLHQRRSHAPGGPIAAAPPCRPKVACRQAPVRLRAANSSRVKRFVIAPQRAAHKVERARRAARPSSRGKSGQHRAELLLVHCGGWGGMGVVLPTPTTVWRACSGHRHGRCRVVRYSSNRRPINDGSPVRRTRSAGPRTLERLEILWNTTQRSTVRGRPLGLPCSNPWGVSPPHPSKCSAEALIGGR